MTTHANENISHQPSRLLLSCNWLLRKGWTKHYTASLVPNDIAITQPRDLLWICSNSSCTAIHFFLYLQKLSANSYSITLLTHTGLQHCRRRPIHHDSRKVPAGQLWKAAGQQNVAMLCHWTKQPSGLLLLHQWDASMVADDAAEAASCCASLPSLMPADRSVWDNYAAPHHSGSTANEHKQLHRPSHYTRDNKFHNARLFTAF